MQTLFNNLMPEDTRSGNVVGGSLWTVGRLRAFLFYSNGIVSWRGKEV